MKQYFAVIGRNPELSLAELEAYGSHITHRQGSIVFFSGDDDIFDKQGFALGGVSKRGTCVSYEECVTRLQEQGVKLLGVSDKKLGVSFKKEGIRRFKLTEFVKTDLEVREKGQEILSFDNELLGRVDGYQDIPFFEAVDFEKPVRGMHIGMMPAKLTQILVNLGVGLLGAKTDTVPTIFDPFCGFGTTGFVSQKLGYHFLGSDINPTPTKQNMSWMKEQSWYSNDRFFTIFKHDVNKAFTQPFVKNASVVVSEGWLGPVMTLKSSRQLKRHELVQRRDSITELYTAFVTNMHSLDPSIPLIITFPQRTFLDEDMSDDFCRSARDLGYKVMQVGELYSRSKQLVARRILKIWR